MDFKNLQVFIAVVEQRSFSKAAQLLYLTQPTVSSHIAMLESEFGTRLVMRRPKEVVPTPAGEVLFDYARRLLVLRTETAQEIDKLIRAQSGTVELASSTVPAQYYLPKLLTTFRQQHPDIALRMWQGNSSEAEARLLSGKAELAFMGKKPDSPRCKAYHFADDALVVITPDAPEYRKLGRDGYFPRSLLTAAPYVNRSPGSGTRLVVEEFLLQMGIAPEKLNVVTETQSTENVRQFVSEGMGISIISRTAAKSPIESGKILCFEFEHIHLRRQLYMVKLKSSALSPAANLLLVYMTERTTGIGNE